MSDFLNEINALLARTQNISSDDRDEAIRLIKEKCRKSKASTSGPCMNCCEPIIYGEIANIHLQKGDAWLEDKFNNWHPVKLKANAAGDRWINDLKESTIFPYCCPDCLDGLAPKFDSLIANAKAACRAMDQREDQKKMDILAGRIKATPARQYWLLVDALTSNPSLFGDLKAMPYKEFLQSRYWAIVRGYVRYKRRETCELCAETRNLQVHHRSYQHRGEEYRHLEDLVLLCSTCHARHHDKLHA